MAIKAKAFHQVYSKTALGKEAIEKRSIPLLALDRRVLILIDGERTVADLYLQLNANDVYSALSRLINKGLVQPKDAVAHASATPLIEVIAPALTQAPQITVTLPADVLAAAKNLMLTTSKESLGLMATRLISEIEQIDDAVSLKTMMARWNMALRESRTAAGRADQLLQAVKDLLPAAI